MTAALLISGTDTGIGKTVFCAGLLTLLGGSYWKPIQAGLEGETDKNSVACLSGRDPENILPEAYRLTTPCSPHRAAEIDNLELDVKALRNKFDLHQSSLQADPLIIEPAGGLLVPITRQVLQIDMYASWNVPVVLCTTTRLGTINHTLLSIEALNRRNIQLIGVAFIGDANEDSEHTICTMGKTKHLGRLPYLEPLNATTLKNAFAENFSRETFLL